MEELEILINYLKNLPNCCHFKVRLQYFTGGKKKVGAGRVKNFYSYSPK